MNLSANEIVADRVFARMQARRPLPVLPRLSARAR
jgi:hypothetical protein